MQWTRGLYHGLAWWLPRRLTSGLLVRLVLFIISHYPNIPCYRLDLDCFISPFDFKFIPINVKYWTPIAKSFWDQYLISRGVTQSHFTFMRKSNIHLKFSSKGTTSCSSWWPTSCPCWGWWCATCRWGSTCGGQTPAQTPATSLPTQPWPRVDRTRKG